MKNKRIVFMGTPEFACSVLKQLIDDEYLVVGVVSQPDKKVGRKQVITKTPVKLLAEDFSIPVLQPQRIKEDYQSILDLDPDLIITCAYGQIIPKVLLETPVLGAINIHASLLPRHRGGAPIHHAIIAGDIVTGISVMRMSPKMDAGAVCFQNQTDILETDTTGTLYAKLQVKAAEAIHASLPSILEGKAIFTEQDLSKVTFSYNISKEDEWIDFKRPTEVVYNHIRGLIPQPVGYCKLQGKTFKLHQVSKGISTNYPAGQVIGLINGAIEIATSDGAIAIHQCQIEGKSKMEAQSFWQGYQQLKGEFVNED